MHSTLRTQRIIFADKLSPSHFLHMDYCELSLPMKGTTNDECSGGHCNSHHKMGWLQGWPCLWQVAVGQVYYRAGCGKAHHKQVAWVVHLLKWWPKPLHLEHWVHGLQKRLHSVLYEVEMATSYLLTKSWALFLVMAMTMVQVVFPTLAFSARSPLGIMVRTNPGFKVVSSVAIVTQVLEVGIPCTSTCVTGQSR